MTVVDMSQWLEDRAGDEALTCVCGSVWFDLVDGAVTLNADRSIVGYAGTLRCRECGKAN